MATPMDREARGYFRAAIHWLDDAAVILERLERAAAAHYLAGYAVECVLKALLLTRTPSSQRANMLVELKQQYRHDLRRLRLEVARRGKLPSAILRDLLFVSSWSPEQRYDPGMTDMQFAKDFLAATRRIVSWAAGRI